MIKYLFIFMLFTGSILAKDIDADKWHCAWMIDYAIPALRRGFNTGDLDDFLNPPTHKMYPDSRDYAAQSCAYDEMIRSFAKLNGYEYTLAKETIINYIELIKEYKDCGCKP